MAEEPDKSAQEPNLELPSLLGFGRKNKKKGDGAVAGTGREGGRKAGAEGAGAAAVGGAAGGGMGAHHIPNPPPPPPAPPDKIVFDPGQQVGSGQVVQVSTKLKGAMASVGAAALAAVKSFASRGGSIIQIPMKMYKIQYGRSQREQQLGINNNAKTLEQSVTDPKAGAGGAGGKK